jgi:hypothetical protein
MNGILARQKRAGDIGRFLSDIQRGEHYFFDIDLSEKQAELFGWNKSTEVGLLVTVS